MMQSILLSDLIGLLDGQSVKVKFNIFNGREDPMVVYMKNPEIINNQWLFWREKKKYFKTGEIVICLLRIGYDQWLLTTIKKITEDLDVQGGINYEGTELPEYSRYYGRIILSFHKTFQSAVVSKDTVWNELEVLQILPSQFDGIDFPGYDNVNLTFNELEAIITRHKRDWVKALENQKANVELAETVTANTKSNYQYGLATLTELLEAENALVEAKNNYSNAILNYKIAEVQYYKAKGDLKTYLK